MPSRWNGGRIISRRRFSNGREKRPGLDRLLKDATARRINMMAARSVDRLGRSLQHLVELLNELQALRCNLYLHQQAIDTTTPSGKAMFWRLRRVRARHDRGGRQFRAGEGQGQGRQARSRNKKDGERSADEERWGMSMAELEKRILRLYLGGTGILKIGKALGIGTGTVQRVLMGAAAPFRRRRR
jgi:DNA invertase Pin-like site-specific DNA recombinase